MKRRRAVAEPSLAQCVLLSMLLHIFLVLLFGTAERGTAGRFGQRAQDLDATLAPYLPDSGYRVTVSPRPEPRESGSAAPPAGAPTQPPSVVPRREMTPAPVVEPTTRNPQPNDASPLQESVPTVESLPSFDRGAPEIVDKAIEPRLEILPTETIPHVEFEVPRNVEPSTTPALPIPMPREVPAPVPKSAPPVAPRLPEPAPEPKSPVIEPALSPVEPPMATPPKIEREAPPTAEPEFKTVPAPPESPPVLAPPVTTPPVTTPPVTTPPVTTPPVTTPPVPFAPRAETPAPRPLEQAPATPEAAAVPATPAAAPRSISPEAAPPAQSERPSERQRAREIEPVRPAIAPSPTLRDAPGTEPLPRLKFGTPEDPDEIFRPRASPPTGVVPPPGQAPRLNLDAANKEKAGAEIAKSNTRRGILNLDPPPPEPVSKLGKAIQKAAQPDCREAYAAMGLLAAPFLLKDTITDTGCRW